MINSQTLLIVKPIDDKYSLNVVYFNSSTLSKHIIKTACTNTETIKSYDNFKKAYKHDAKHDVAKSHNV